MKKKDILNSNKLIAEFMAIPRNKDQLKTYDCSEVEWSPDIVEGTGCMWLFTDNDLKFHSSWSWLMPVVEKIERTAQGYSVVIGPLYTRISDGDEDPDIIFCNICNGDGNNRLDICYRAVIEFIKWYNENK